MADDITGTHADHRGGSTSSIPFATQTCFTGAGTTPEAAENIMG